MQYGISEIQDSCLKIGVFLMNGTEIITFLSSNFPTVMTTVGAVTGSLFTAIFLRHNTAVTEFEKIKSGQFKEVADELLESGKMTFTEYYKANNFLQVAKKADEYYSKKNSKEETSSYDFDWFVRFYEAVGNISDEKMQDIWAKILAGEISHPSSYSLKTLDVLKNISKRDAELFVKVCSCSFSMGNNHVFLPNNDAYIDGHDIKYIDIMKLNEHGLIFNDGTIGYTVSITKEPRILFINNNLIMTIASASGKEEKATIKQYLFTEVGAELSSIISEKPSDDDFIEFGRKLAENKSYKISIHKIIEWGENSIQHETENLLELSHIPDN